MLMPKWHQKNYSAKIFISSLVLQLYRLLMATFVNDWVPRMLFVCLINKTTFSFHDSF